MTNRREQTAVRPDTVSSSSLVTDQREAFRIRKGFESGDAPLNKLGGLSLSAAGEVGPSQSQIPLTLRRNGTLAPRIQSGSLLIASVSHTPAEWKRQCRS